MRRLSLPLPALQEALDAAPNALQKGVQQFLTPAHLATALLAPYRLASSATEITIADLFGAGQGALLSPFTDHLAARTFAVELDTACKPPGVHHLLHADTSIAAPLLIETGAQFDLLLANPPFSLTWTVEGQPLNSTLATFRWMLELLAPEGQGMLLCNAASITALQKAYPHDIFNVHTTLLLPNYFPQTGRWADMTLAALYFSSRPRSNPKTFDFSQHPADTATLNAVRHALATAPGLIRTLQPSTTADSNPLPRFRAVAAEVATRRKQRRHGHDAYNILLRPNGTVSTYLTPFEHFAKAPKLPRELVADLASLNGRHLRDLVVARSQRRALEAAVHGGIWRVDPTLPPAISAAVADYNAQRTPLSRLNPVQCLGYVDELNTLLCIKPLLGCQPGERYTITTQITEGRTIRHQFRYDRPPIYPGGPHPKEEIHVAAMELEITVLGPHSELHFTHHPKLSTRVRKPLDLETLIAHFEIPTVPSLEEAYATEYQDAIDRLMALCPLSSPPSPQKTPPRPGTPPPAPPDPTATPPALQSYARRLAPTAPAPHPQAPPAK